MFGGNNGAPFHPCKNACNVSLQYRARCLGLINHLPRLSQCWERGRCRCSESMLVKRVGEISSTVCAVFVVVRAMTALHSRRSVMGTPSGSFAGLSGLLSGGGAGGFRGGAASDMAPFFPQAGSAGLGPQSPVRWEAAVTRLNCMGSHGPRMPDGQRLTWAIKGF